MLARNTYRVRKSPLAGRRKKAAIYGIVTVSILVIGYGVYSVLSFHPTIEKKASASITTGDQPIKQQQTVYVNADGGLSLRSDHSSSGSRLLLIPNQTKLTVDAELEGWYQVTYNSKTGWISKQYTTTTAPAADPTASWTSFSFKSGQKMKYEPGWKVQDYGANATTSASDVVAFSNQDLPQTLPSGSDFIAPVVVNFTTKSADDANASYSKISGVTIDNLTVGSLTAKKYTYTSTTSNTQVTSVVLSSGSAVVIFSEAGGYADDLLKMLNTFTIN